MDSVFVIDNNVVLLFLRVNIELIIVLGMVRCDLLDCCVGLIIIIVIFNDNNF